MNNNKIKTYLTVGFALLILFSLYPQDQRIADSLILIYKKTNFDASSKLELLNNISFNSTNPDSALFYAKKLLKVSEQQNDYYNLYRAYYLIGYSLTQKGKPEQALQSYFQSAQFAKKNNNKKGLGIAYSSIGSTYSSSKNYLNSIVYYNKAIDILSEINDSISLASAFLNLGTNYYNFKKLDSALVFFGKAENIFQKLNYETGIAYCYGNMGLIEIKQKKYFEADTHIKEAINILLKYNDNYSIAAYYSSLATMYKERNDLNKVLDYAKKAYSISLKGGFMAQKRDVSELLSNLYAEKKDFINAYKYQTLYYSYRDSIINEQTIREMADLRTEYEVSQKQAEIDILTKKRKVQQIIGIGLTSILLVSGVLLTLLYRNSRRNRILSELLVEQKAELQLQHDQLEELNKTKDRFFSIISHDLRGPIGVLNGTTMLIREYLESKDYKQLSELTSNMEYSVKKVQHLLDNLLEWAVSQQGKFNYQPEKVELNEVVHEAMGIFEGMAIAKNISFHFVCKFDKFFIVADRNSLLTILRNLISNAIKFTPRNGSITVMAYKSEKNVIIKVSDTGVGITQKTLKNLFKIDENKSTWGTEREKGLGLGLSLVNEFVKMNHGTIDVESEEGVGSTFTVKFPTEAALKKILLPQDI